MKTLEFAKLVYEKRKPYFDKWLYYARKIKVLVEKELGEVTVYVFGSVAKGEAIQRYPT